MMHWGDDDNGLAVTNGGLIYACKAGEGWLWPWAWHHGENGAVLSQQRCIRIKEPGRAAPKECAKPSEVCRQAPGTYRVRETFPLY